MKARTFVLIAGSIASLAVPSTAVASIDEPRETVNEIQAALAEQPFEPPAIDAGLGADAPDTGSEDLQLDGGVTLGLPAVGDGTTVEATTVYDAAGTDSAQIAVQNVGVGTRALINIDDASAPERYEFRMSGDVSRLQPNPDGSVAAFDAGGELVGGFAPPWAYDAAHRPVATHFEIAGTTLIQVVHHRAGGFEYGVTADPIWLGLAIRACMAVRCYRWMPGYVQRQFLYGHITVGVTAWLRAWFCAKTFIC